MPFGHVMLCGCGVFLWDSSVSCGTAADQAVMVAELCRTPGVCNDCGEPMRLGHIHGTHELSNGSLAIGYAGLDLAGT